MMENIVFFKFHSLNDTIGTFFMHHICLSLALGTANVQGVFQEGCQGLHTH